MEMWFSEFHTPDVKSTVLGLTGIYIPNRAITSA